MLTSRFHSRHGVAHISAAEPPIFAQPPLDEIPLLLTLLIVHVVRGPLQLNLFLCVVIDTAALIVADVLRWSELSGAMICWPESLEMKHVTSNH